MRNFTNQKVMKPFDFVFDNIDSTSEEKPFLPIFLTESFSRYYYRKNPKSSMENIKATKVAGVKNESVSQFLGDMYQSTNVYEKLCRCIWKKLCESTFRFRLPLHINITYWIARLLIARKCYKIAFLPRRKGELVFEGEMWINDTTYAVKQIDASITEDANINWINTLFCSS